MADMQAAQEDARRIARELRGAQTSVSTYEEERTSVRALVRLLVRAVVDRVRRRGRGRGRLQGQQQRGQQQQERISIAGAPSQGEGEGQGEEGVEYEAAAYEKARLYAQRTAARAGQGQQEGGELERLVASLGEEQ